jgi:hypothetical protein
MGVLDIFRRKRTDEVKVAWGPCCFCGADIEPSDIDPCRVSVETASGKWQAWFCHSACFRDRITTGAPIDLSPAHF